MRIVVSLRRGSVSIKLREQTMCLRKQETDAAYFVYYLSRFLTNKVQGISKMGDIVGRGLERIRIWESEGVVLRQ